MVALRIVVVGERKVVPGIEPAVVGAAETLEGAMFDHDILRWGALPPPGLAPVASMAFLG
jgi:hypothetical protein